MVSINNHSSTLVPSSGSFDFEREKLHASAATKLLIFFKMSDTGAKNEDRTSQDRDDGGDDEVRDGLFVKATAKLCARRHENG